MSRLKHVCPVVDVIMRGPDIVDSGLEHVCPVVDVIMRGYC